MKALLLLLSQISDEDIFETHRWKNIFPDDRVVATTVEEK
jgi:hypothetical protein